MESTYLIHHGVKGQKWGVRNEKRKAERKEYNKTYREMKKRQRGEYWAKTALGSIGAVVVSAAIIGSVLTKKM